MEKAELMDVSDQLCTVSPSVRKKTHKSPFKFNSPVIDCRESSPIELHREIHIKREDDDTQHGASVSSQVKLEETETAEDNALAPVSPGGQCGPIRQVLWQELLHVTNEIAHLKKVGRCLADYDRALSRLELENSLLRNMERNLLERAEVAERGLSLARDTCRRGNEENEELREQNRRLARKLECSRGACQEQGRRPVGYQSTWRHAADPSPDGMEEEEWPSLSNEDEQPSLGNQEEPPSLSNEDERPMLGNEGEPPSLGDKDDPPVPGNEDSPPPLGSEDEQPKLGSEDGRTLPGDEESERDREEQQPRGPEEAGCSQVGPEEEAMERGDGTTAYTLCIQLVDGSGEARYRMALPLSHEGSGAVQVCVLLQELEEEVNAQGGNNASGTCPNITLRSCLGSLAKTLRGVECWVEEDEDGSYTDTLEEVEGMDEDEYVQLVDDYADYDDEDFETIRK